MKLTRLRWFLAVLAFVLPGLACNRAVAASAAWTPAGPDGGDARRFAYSPSDPGRIYVGTTDGWIYVSSDGGSSWSRLARLGTQDDLVVDSLVVDRSDPRTLYAGVWVIDRPDGGIYISHDLGRTWTEMSGMKGQSVRALTQARSNPRILVAGTLRGVYRSEDRGLHWSQISPAGSAEIHEVESIAIDPYDPGIIYAGTWHLPWKTMDGGKDWREIDKGVIDDSDVFSMIVDPTRPSVLFLSACSGIYRTDDFGDDFRKVQGIPSTARRTRSLRMDPADRNTVYAGTTEGLYKTQDGGQNWTRTTGPDVIVNDVYVDPRNPRHLLLATDRSGVLASEDGGLGFQPSNTGFSQRQVTALLADAGHPGTIYAGVINDKSYGGVFVSTDEGETWKQQSDGLKGRDIFELARSREGTLLAGSSDGVFRWEDGAWVQADAVAGETPEAPVAAKSPVRSRGRRRTERRAEDSGAKDPVDLRGRVTALAAADGTWYAATPQGVFRSVDEGQSWSAVLRSHDANAFFRDGDTVAIAASGRTVFAGRRQGIMASDDEGATWKEMAFPEGLTTLHALALAPGGALWAGGREGIFVSSDQGHTWKALQRLPVVAITSIGWDPQLQRMIVTSGEGTIVYAVDPEDDSWMWWNTGWTVRSVASLNGRLAAASLYSGVVLQPKVDRAGAGRPVEDARK
jgi:photosystem II stability/assembly factor-like uncharacterized protein